MKNNDGKGLYEIGEPYTMPCSCTGKAEIVGYSHYVNPECELCNKFHPDSKGYNYKRWEDRPRNK